MPDKLGPEFRLVVACCRRPSSAAALAGVRRSAGTIDWDRFAAIAARHRVQGLVHDALRTADIAPPPAVATTLAAAARTIALQGLRLAGETQRLTGLADQAGIAILILKGAPLAQLAYGTVAIKHASDIDLLIDARDLAAVRTLLAGADYDAMPIVVAKDEPWRNAARGIVVELHTALADSPRWLAGIGIGSPAQRVAIGGGRGVPTLAPAELFAYLCVHGAVHGWSRLKWLADLAALVAATDPDELARWHDRARRRGAGRCVAQALILCADLFGTRLDPAHERRLRRDPLGRWLVAAAYRSFTGKNETIELDARPLSTLRIHLAQLVFTQGWRSRGELLATKLGARAGATRGAAFLAWPASAARWLSGRFRRAAPVASRSRDANGPS